MVKSYYLVRKEDVSGVSGTGIIAEVAEFSTGKTVVAWLGEVASVIVYDSLDGVMKIHGHDGKTVLMEQNT